MSAVHQRALPIATISAPHPGDGNAPGVGPVVSSAHLASGRLPGLSELEYGLMVAASAFDRWMVRCMAAAGPALSATEVAILHSVAHRGRERRMADIALVLNIEDMHVVSYALRKLEAAGLIATRRAGKEKLVSISDTGFEACQRYGQLRDKLLLDIAGETRISDDKLSEAAALLRMLSGVYDQAARAAATF